MSVSHEASRPTWKRLWACGETGPFMAEPRLRVKPAAAVTCGARPAAVTPYVARAWRRRASACCRSRLEAMARSTSDVSIGSLNDVHHRTSSACFSGDSVIDGVGPAQPAGMAVSEGL